MSHQLDEKAIFRVLAALREPSEREAYLSFACGSDGEARRRIEALLMAHETEHGLLDHNAPIDELTSDFCYDQELASGSVVGRYKILEQIGEGGFGVVYMAQQQTPIRRRVALKIIKPGMDTKQVMARFEAERQALAMMDHPHIARVLDADATEQGRPFFVMELVRGIPITDYCNQHALSTRERLEVFVDVCAAVQYAHQKGIIHRDIKPSNILVGQDGERHLPKVIDFGIAKATQGQLTDKTLFTQFRQFIGTPAYVSPEQTQASAIDTDTRTDIYSLGVLMYELLTGLTPLDSRELKQAGFEEMCRRVREEEPLTLSSRLSRLTQEQQSTVAQCRRTQPSQLASELKGDLDWIVMKSLEKDRGRRYDTAAALAQEVQRYLNHEPVTAAAPSAAYRFSKFVRRHRGPIVVATTIALLLVVGSVISTWLAIDANRNAANARKKTAEAVAAQKEASRATQRADDALKRERAERLRGDQLRYGADMSLVQLAIQLADVPRAKELLERHIPAEGAQDLRGWEWRFLYGQLIKATSVVKTHEEIHSIALSPDGQTLAVAGVTLGEGKDNREIPYYGDRTDLSPHKNSRTIVVLDPHMLHGVARTFKTPSSARQLTFSSNGKFLELVSHDVTRLAVAEMVAHDSNWSPPVELWPLKITPDRKYAVGLANVGPQTRARKKLVCYALSDSTPYGQTKSFLLPDDIWLSRELQVSPNGLRVAVAAAGRELRFFSMPYLKPQQTIATPGEVSVANWSSDSKLVATGYDHPFRVDVWDAESGEQMHTFEAATSPGSCLAFSPDNTLLAFGEVGDQIHVFDLTSNTRRHSFLAHDGESLALQFLADGRTLISGGYDGMLKSWDASLPPKTRLRQLSEKHELWFMDYSSDGNQLAFSAADGIVRLFDADTKDLIGTLPPPREQVGRPLGWPRSRIHFSGNGRTLIVDNNDDTFSVYDVHSRKRRHTLTHPVPLFDLDISSDGNLAASAGIGKYLMVWDINAGSEILRFEHPQGRRIDSVAMSTDSNSRSLAYAAENEVTLMQLDTKELTTAELKSKAWSLTFSHDGTLLFCGCFSEVVVLDVPSMRRVENLPGSRGPIPCIALSPDEMTLAIPSWGGYVQLFSRKVNAEVGRLPIPIDSMAAAAFSPDGNELIVSTWGKGVYQFSAPSFDDIAQRRRGISLP